MIPIKRLAACSIRARFVVILGSLRGFDSRLPLLDWRKEKFSATTPLWTVFVFSDSQSLNRVPIYCPLSG